VTEVWSKSSIWNVPSAPPMMYSVALAMAVNAEFWFAMTSVCALAVCWKK
jgi:hypothetical protein